MFVTKNAFAKGTNNMFNSNDELLQPLAPLCEVCCAEKPKDVGIKYKIWSCKFCTLENSVDVDKCLACDQWRYSHGSPVSTRAPNLGT